MKDEYDFSKGIRGKFYAGDADINLPIYYKYKIHHNYPSVEG
jgi:hypothetical protein